LKKVFKTMANIEINGKKIKARDGAMIIEAADEAGIYIPRFCYHRKLSIAANCRMCLVEVEKVAKTLPACATPVTDGMKILTKSPKALSAQKGVMEFLLINHPLDCPICDQGGECELQDLAVGYGSDFSEFSENKRVVKDKNLGSLIATEMTRCIHCTRCVRFGEEIAGIRELGATGRGEHTEIGTYVSKAVSSELSGNVIDLCPVGALTSKPFRFSARAWEMVQRDTIAPHDCLGSNLHVHVRDNKVMRVVPRDNEAINETWISDRDRFSYQAVNSAERLKIPKIRSNGVWKDTDWENALKVTVDGIKSALKNHGAAKIGVLASATATLEELYLTQKLARGLGINNIDHRIRQTDFSDQDIAPVFPWLGQNITNLEQLNSVLLVGSNIRQDQPLAAHRLRKAAQAGANVMCINSVDYDFYLPVAEKLVVSPLNIPAELAAVAKALLQTSQQTAPDGLSELLKSVTFNDKHETIARQLVEGVNSSVLLGPQAITHPQSSTLRALATAIAQMSNSHLGYLTESGNTSGAWLSGVLPHRSVAGEQAPAIGLNALEMFKDSLKAYVLLDLEPDVDSAIPHIAMNALMDAEFVVVLTPFDSSRYQQYADVLLPIGPFTETAGTFINVEGVWQSFTGVVPPLGEARPAWKVLRVLGNLFQCEGFDYVSSEEILTEVREKAATVKPEKATSWRCPASITKAVDKVVRIAEMQMYAWDTLQRRAEALQNTPSAYPPAIRVNEKLAKRLGLADGDRAAATQNGARAVLPVVVDNTVADDSVLIHSGLVESAALNADLEPLIITRI
jgi:NADH-quinone oxidoreductase subunit G